MAAVAQDAEHDPPLQRRGARPPHAVLAADPSHSAGAQLDPVELIRHCEPRLAYFAIARYVEIVDELPLTENGKVRKAVLRDAGITEDMWDREAAGVTVRRRGR